MGQDTHAVMSKLRPWLLQRAQKLARPGIDAEDLVQETLMDFGIRFRDRKLSEEQAKAYLATVLRHQLLLRVRSNGVRERAASDPTMMSAPEEPERLAFEQVSDGDLEEAMESLSQKQREVLLLVIGGTGYAEISKRLGIPVGAVGKRAFDARQRLRSRFLEIMARREKAKGT